MFDWHAAIERCIEVKRIVVFLTVKENKIKCTCLRRRRLIMLCACIGRLLHLLTTVLTFVLLLLMFFCAENSSNRSHI